MWRSGRGRGNTGIVHECVHGGYRFHEQSNISVLQESNCSVVRSISTSDEAHVMREDHLVLSQEAMLVIRYVHNLTILRYKKDNLSPSFSPHCLSFHLSRSLNAVLIF